MTVRDGGADAEQQEQTGGETRTLAQSLAFFAAAAGRECNIQDARGRGQ